MPLEVISIYDKEKWDILVYSFRQYDIYYLSGYVSAFQIHGDGEPILIYFTDGFSRAIQIVMKRDVSKVPAFVDKIYPSTYFDLATPYGYGGFIWEGSPNWIGLNTAFMEYCLDESIVSEFVRFHPILENAKGADAMYELTQRGVTVAIDISSPEAIWGGFTTENRNMIRKAQNNNIQIRHSSSDSILMHFQEIYTETMLRDNADEYYFFKDCFYEKLLNDFLNNFTVFYASKGEDIVATSIIMFVNTQMHYHLSGLLKEYRKYAPTNLLLYEAALWGCKQNYMTFHLGGGMGGKKDSLYKFKKEFNRYQNHVFYTGQKVYNYDVYNKLVVLKRGNSIKEESVYFPEYRA